MVRRCLCWHRPKGSAFPGLGVLWGAAPGAGAAALKLCLNMMLSCFLCDGSLKTYPGHVANMSAISWTFVFVFLKSIPQKKKKPFPLPFLISQAAKVGLKRCSSSTGFCAVASPRTWTKAPCPALTTHSMARQCPCQPWMSPAPPPRSEKSSTFGSKWPRQISVSLALGCTSSSQAQKPRSALGPFWNVHSLLTQLC